MDPPAPPPDQVRGTQVGGGEIPVFLSFEHPEQSPFKGVNNTENNASLIKRKDGSIRLTYSTKNDIKYVSYQDRQYLQPVPTDPDMCGLTKSQWTQLLSIDSTVRAALSYDEKIEAEQRKYKLNQLKRDELMYALRNYEDPDTKERVYADFLTVQISDGNGTHYEQTAVCAAVTKTDLKLIREEDSLDLGHGIFQLSQPRDIAILPSFDQDALFTDAPSRDRLPVGYRQFLMVYKDVKSKEDTQPAL